MLSKLYYNLHKECLSVQQDGIVVQHTMTAVLMQVEFRVSQAGRERVLRERRKNVHAFIVGNLIETSDWEHLDVTALAVTYNPYKFNSFVRRDDHSPIYTASKVLVTGRAVYILEP